MKIIRVLNNSAVISENQEHEEIIALGKGIAYGKKAGDEFVQEFKDENDNITPSDQFKEQLSAMVKEESSSNVIPFRRNYKKIGAVAASFAVLVIGVGVYGIMGNINSDKSKISENMNMVAGMNDDAENLDDQSDSIAGTYHFSPDNADSDVYGSFAGEYKQSGDAAVTDGYLSIVQSPNELSIRFFGAEEWTKTSDIKVQEDGSILKSVRSV